MHPETINRLKGEALFELPQAIAIAEAIDIAIDHAQFVTVAILDARLAVLKSELKSEIDRKLDRLRLQIIVAILLAGTATGPLGTAALNALRHSL